MAETTNTEPKNAEEPAAAAPQDPAAPRLPPRVAHWCSMLLDLSRRNRLLNFKDGAGAVRLAFDAPEFLEDAIAEDKVYRVLETPEKGPRIAALFTDAAPRPAAAEGNVQQLPLSANDANANTNENAEEAEAREFLKK